MVPDFWQRQTEKGKEAGVHADNYRHRKVDDAAVIDVQGVEIMRGCKWRINFDHRRLRNYSHVN
jgi:hypothetical protein